MLKVGDKVRVRRLKDLVNEFGMNDGGICGRHIECGQGVNFIYSMFQFCGRIYRVDRLNGQYILLDGAGWFTYTANMLEDPKTGGIIELPDDEETEADMSYEYPIPF